MAAKKARGRYLERGGRGLADFVDLAAIREAGIDCGICGSPLMPSAPVGADDCTEVDHRIPICQGGDHVAANLQAVHRRCNYLKSATDMPQQRARP